MLPIPNEVANTLSIFDPNLQTWSMGWWNIFTQRNSNKVAAINIASIGSNLVVSGVAGKSICITSLAWTVAGEVNITLYGGASAISGPMDFGGSSEPRGMVSNFGFHHIEIPEGQGFSISLSDAVQVSGMVCYHLK